MGLIWTFQKKISYGDVFLTYQSSPFTFTEGEMGYLLREMG